MLSRVADSLYWLGRYAERTETNTQILASQLDEMLEYSQADGKFLNRWKKVVEICGYSHDFEQRYDEINQQVMIDYLLKDAQNFNAIFKLIENIRENAKNARDIIPNELWEVWNELYLQLPDTTGNTSILHTMEQLLLIRRTCLTATGIIDSLMTRDESFLFLKIGKWMERAEKNALTLYHLMQHDEKTLERGFVANTALKMTNALDDFTTRNRSRKSGQVINFLIGDLQCTRSVAYGLKKIKSSILTIENGKQQIYATQLFLAVEELEQFVQLDATMFNNEERVQWVNSIRLKLTQLGPIFSKTYYLTPPILVDNEVFAKQM